MYSNRKEGFRYEFGSPLPCSFDVIAIDGVPTEGSSGDAQLINISPHGMKIRFALDIPLAEKRIDVKITFQLLHEHFTVLGKLVWQKRDYPHYTYGVYLEVDETMERNIIEELKRYTKHLRFEQHA